VEGGPEIIISPIPKQSDSIRRYCTEVSYYQDTMYTRYEISRHEITAWDYCRGGLQRKRE